jgi:hypothetical protein
MPQAEGADMPQAHHTSSLQVQTGGNQSPLLPTAQVTDAPEAEAPKNLLIVIRDHHVLASLLG